MSQDSKHPHLTCTVTQNLGEGAAAPNIAGHRSERSLETKTLPPRRNRVSSTYFLHASRVHSQEAPHLFVPGGGRLAREQRQRPPGSVLKHGRTEWARVGTVQSRKSRGAWGACSPAQRRPRQAAGWHQPGVLWVSFWGCVLHRPPGPRLEFSPVAILKFFIIFEQNLGMGPTNYEAGPGHKSWEFMKQVKEGILQAGGGSALGNSRKPGGWGEGRGTEIPFYPQTASFKWETGSGLKKKCF